MKKPSALLALETVQASLAFRFWQRLEVCSAIAAFTFAFGAVLYGIAASWCSHVGAWQENSELLGLSLYVPLIGMLLAFIPYGIAEKQQEWLTAPAKQALQDAFTRFIVASRRAEAAGVRVADVCEGLNSEDAATRLEALLASR